MAMIPASAGAFFGADAQRRQRCGPSGAKASRLAEVMHSRLAMVSQLLLITEDMGEWRAAEKHLLRRRHSFPPLRVSRHVGPPKRRQIGVRNVTTIH
jgi:hypothetical protein